VFAKNLTELDECLALVLDLARERGARPYLKLSHFAGSVFYELMQPPLGCALLKVGHHMRVIELAKTFGATDVNT